MRAGIDVMSIKLGVTAIKQDGMHAKRKLTTTKLRMMAIKQDGMHAKRKLATTKLHVTAIRHDTAKNSVTLKSKSFVSCIPKRKT